MVVILDEDLTHEEQKLFGELYDTRGHRIQWCRYCGQWGIYLTRNNHNNTIILHNLDDDGIHCCVPMQCVKGERIFQ